VARVSDSFVKELNACVVRSGTSAMTVEAFGMGRDAARVDGYCDDDALDGLVREFHLLDDARGNVTLRAAPLRLLRLEGRDTMPRAVVAAELAESHEPRERSAGLRALNDQLRELYRAEARGLAPTEPPRA